MTLSLIISFFTFLVNFIHFNEVRKYEIYRKDRYILNALTAFCAFMMAACAVLVFLFW